MYGNTSNTTRQRRTLVDERSRGQGTRTVTASGPNFRATHKGQCFHLKLLKKYWNLYNIIIYGFNKLPNNIIINDTV